MIVKKDHEYAGFHYTILKEGGFHVAAPHPSQHQAAGKLKHIKSAIEDYLNEIGYGFRSASKEIVQIINASVAQSGRAKNR